jgi:hypothetical protein
LQALVGFSVVAALLLTSFAYREQIGEILKNRNKVIAVAETGTTPGVSTPTAIATASPGLTGSPTAGTPTATATGLELINMEGITVVDGTVFIDGIPVGTKTNSGLHLGQTPGAPAAPGQGNPGNENQPDKPDKPDNPNKPDKPENNDKTEKTK